MQQDIRFCKTSDGVRIAYAVMGGGPPLLWVPGWLSHLELDLEFPPFRERCERLAQDFTLVRLDKRGSGLSQRGISDFSLAAHVRDVEAVAEASQLGRFALAGYSEGAPISIAYASQHPDTISHLILLGGWAEGSKLFGGSEIQTAIVSIAKNEWGFGSKVIADYVFGEDLDPSIQRRFALYQQQAATSIDAVASANTLFRFDVRPLLGALSTPTLVVHARGDRTAPIEDAQDIASMIPGARFISVEGNHVPDRKQIAQMDQAIRAFVLGRPSTRDATAGGSASPSDLVTILFTDMEGSTALTQRLGDAKAHALLGTHNALIREALSEYAGTEIKHTGDGIMASFGSARRAIDCAVAIQTRLAAEENPIRVRIGLNAGEPVAEGKDLFGSSVQLAARICARAEAGQILVSNVVRELAIGKGFQFAEIGDVTLKGFQDPLRLYEVKWKEQSG